MSYHPLSNEDGLSPEERLERVMELVNKIEPYFDQLTPKEKAFVEQMSGYLPGATPKQLFWLRDILERYQ